MATDEMEPINGSITLNTKIMTPRGFGSTCYEGISEVVRIWIQGDFVIIWSCSEKNRKDNIGILFLVYTPRENYKYRNDRKAFKSLLAEYKVFASKFLNEPILKMISWDEDPRLDACEKLNPYGTCVNNVTFGGGKTIFKNPPVIRSGGSVKKPEMKTSNVNDASYEDQRRGMLLCVLIVFLFYIPLIGIEVRFLQ